MEGELFIGATEDRDKVIFKRLDGSFGGVAAMIVWWYQLVIDAMTSEIDFVGR